MEDKIYTPVVIIMCTECQKITYKEYDGQYYIVNPILYVCPTNSEHVVLLANGTK